MNDPFRSLSATALTYGRRVIIAFVLGGAAVPGTLAHATDLMHITPTPALPVTTDPVQAVDVFSVHLAGQIHAGLFRLNAANMPEPYLTERFQVSDDGRQYTFTLRKVRFHNGTPLNAAIVKQSLERVVKVRAAGYMRLAALAGFEEFRNGQAGSIAGISSGRDPSELVLRLTRPAPDLIITLADVAFSVTLPGGPTASGLGPYKVTGMNAEEVALIRDSQHFAPGRGPDAVRYIQTSKDEAVRGFKEGRYHDLFLHPVNRHDLETLGDRVNIWQIPYTPRTYIMALHGRNVPREWRTWIFNQINRQQIARECFGGAAAAESFVPEGFLGFEPGQYDAVVTADTASPSVHLPRLAIRIALGITAEDCLREHLIRDLTDLPDGVKADIRIDDNDKILSDWINGNIDGFIGYLETEKAEEMFMFFHPDSQFNIGIYSDKTAGRLIDLLSSQTDLLSRSRTASDLSRHVAGLRTVLPLLQPPQFAVYHRRYKPTLQSLRSPVYLRYDQLEPHDTSRE